MEWKAPASSEDRKVGRGNIAQLRNQENTMVKAVDALLASRVARELVCFSCIIEGLQLQHSTFRLRSSHRLIRGGKKMNRPGNLNRALSGTERS